MGRQTGECKAVSRIAEYFIVIFLTILASFYVFSRRQNNRNDVNDIKVVRDTVRDTILIIQPLSEKRTPRDSIIIALPEISIVMPRDTVHDTVYVRLPSENIVWTDSFCSVYAHGVMTEIDSVRHFNTTMQIYHEPIPHQKRWGIGIQAGYGASRDGLSPYVGVGLTYNLIRF